MRRLLIFKSNPTPEEFKKFNIPMIGTYSEIASRRRCPVQHKYAYVDSLEKKIPGLPLTMGSLGHRLLEAKYRDGDWKPELEKYVKEEWSTLFEEQREVYGDLPGEIERLMRGYDYYYQNDNWKVLDVEVSFLVRLTEKVGLAGVIDLIVQDKNSMIWVVDHKFTKSIPGDTFLLMEVQTSLYYWVATLKYGKDMVAGTILNYIKTIPPAIPKVNKDGTLSKAKINTDLPTLLEVLKKNNLNPEDYPEQIERAKKTSQEFYVRKRLDRPVALLKNTIKDAVATIYDCHSKRPLTRTISKQCEWDCDYLLICLTEIQGGDPTFLIKQQYQIKENKNKEVFRNGNSK